MRNCGNNPPTFVIKSFNQKRGTKKSIWDAWSIEVENLVTASLSLCYKVGWQDLNGIELEPSHSVERKISIIFGMQPLRVVCAICFDFLFSVPRRFVSGRCSWVCDWILIASSRSATIIDFFTFRLVKMSKAGLTNVFFVWWRRNAILCTVRCNHCTQRRVKWSSDVTWDLTAQGLSLNPARIS